VFIYLYSFRKIVVGNKMVISERGTGRSRILVFKNIIENCYEKIFTGYLIYVPVYENWNFPG
jgi:hypothetical protein